MLIEPICQAALLHYPQDDLVLFSNPASLKRENLTVRVSMDGGRTWPTARVVYANAAAYSSLAVLADGSVGLLYENGDEEPYERLTFARLPIDWLRSR
jgi:sialidase-1